MGQKRIQLRTLRGGGFSSTGPIFQIYYLGVCKVVIIPYYKLKMLNRFTCF